MERPAAKPPAEAETPAASSSKSDDGDKGAESDRGAEIGGREGPDPTRYGDWEINGRCIDF
ncbi:MAG: DUF1674 domain-containing protein [Rhodospirillaceae bacterium]|nr:DUF1674 domain-containing protein [Rhodospirillaceae bacterium]RPG02971.1 MAG: DUF1674 domain-containing protein [Rhodospirillaceae bacterium TMED63]RZO39177.1 MAG: DUF1674 domain-containing protein [Rhodospirillaceae bacterium]